ncbi:MAG: radical SAM protein, partial [Desulfurococcaceae archaeon]
MTKLKVIREFDPWKSPLCTCPRKYSLHPYTGCDHSCLYCYATSY